MAINIAPKEYWELLKLQIIYSTVVSFVHIVLSGICYTPTQNYTI